MKVLITSGATREPIDSVRYISNFSTGKTASLIAQHFVEKNWEVLYCHGTGAVLASHTTNKEFSSFENLNRLLEENLSSKNFDLVIHAAAVSDYSLESIFADGQELKPSMSKISRPEKLMLQLKKNFKILNRLKSYSKNKDIGVIGFKLTTSNNPQEQLQAVQKVFSGGDVDLVVHNDWQEIQKSKEHHFGIFNSETELIGRSQGATSLALKLEQWAKEIK